jgi:DNA-binding NarL/FixJ family response regulator
MVLGDMVRVTQTGCEVLTKTAREIAANQQRIQAHRLKLLTARECEIIALVTEGLKNKTIAARLFISEATVRHHLSSIFSKLSVADRYGLIIYAFRHGLAEVPR